MRLGVGRQRYAAPDRSRRRRWFSHSNTALLGLLSLAPVCRSDTHPMQCRGAKSFVDDLGLSRGVVFSRAVALLRSIETKPPDSMICPLWTGISSARQSQPSAAGDHLASDEVISVGSFSLSISARSEQMVSSLVSPCFKSCTGAVPEGGGFLKKT